MPERLSPTTPTQAPTRSPLFILFPFSNTSRKKTFVLHLRTPSSKVSRRPNRWNLKNVEFIINNQIYGMRTLIRTPFESAATGKNMFQLSSDYIESGLSNGTFFVYSDPVDKLSIILITINLISTFVFMLKRRWDHLICVLYNREKD